MSVNYYPAFLSEPESKIKVVQFVGVTTSATKVLGDGVTVTWISTGIYDLAFGTDAPTAFATVMSHQFAATTASAVKGFTLVPGVFNTTTNKLRINVTNAAETLTDLAALQWLTLTILIKFAPSGV